MNIADFVNIQAQIDEAAYGSGVEVTEGAKGSIIVAAPGVKHRLRVREMHFPLPEDVSKYSGDKTLLVLRDASAAAKEAAKHLNHLTLPELGIRIVLRGIILVVPERKVADERVETKLRGMSGVICETLLLYPQTRWSVRSLADKAGASVGLTHRVLDRLESERILDYERSAVRRLAFVNEPLKLAQLWLKERGRMPKPFAKTFVYANTPEDLATKLSTHLPDACLGGVFAANRYYTRLANVPLPLVAWLPFTTSKNPAIFASSGIEEVEQGANIEFYAAKGDVWRHHQNRIGGMTLVSAPRAWLEIGDSTGRIQELADGLLRQLI